MRPVPTPGCKDVTGRVRPDGGCTVCEADHGESCRPWRIPRPPSPMSARGRKQLAERLAKAGADE